MAICSKQKSAEKLRLYSHVLLYVLLCISASFCQSIAALTSRSQSNATDELALLSFKSLLSDPPGALQSWKTSVHYCKWRGVSCGSRKNPDRVTGLKLEFLNLTGSLSPYIGNLSFLGNLHLSHNHLQGSIPQELGRLIRLQTLNLTYNSFTGEIPANLSSCKSLHWIRLSNNNLRGVIPREIGLLQKLSVLSLGANPLSGSIPSSLGNTSLTGLFLYDNGLQGRIPDSFGRLSSLKIFQVTNNSLSGNIPPSLYNISSLVSLTASSNRLSGTLPPYMFQTLPRIQTLILGDNQLSGPIPVSLPNASNLVEIDLVDNYLLGTIPSNLGLLQKLYWINLSNNMLEARKEKDLSFLTSLTNCSLLGTLAVARNNLAGQLPSSISNLSRHMDWLAIGQNPLYGTIPEGIGNLVNLTALTLDHNHLTGHIPETLGKLRKLRVLLLPGNKFTGQIPHSIGNLTQLIQLNLESSGLSGSIPPSFVGCKSLQVASLANNNLSGTIPQELLILSSLTIFLNLSYNLLNGSLPAAVGNLKNLGELDVSENKLSGEIPNTIGSCQSLELLYMKGNYFTGIIPQSLSNLKGLRVLDLSRNNLSGDIPRGLESLDVLQLLNLSYNSLEGEVANKGVFSNSSAVSLEGNKNLCGGIEQLHLHSCYTHSSRTKQFPLALKIIIALATVILFLVIVIIAARHQLKRPRMSSLPTSSTGDWFTRITYADLQKATNGFSRSNLIGSGSFGSVYKGVIGSNDDIVAVKVLNLQQQGALHSFIAECEVLRNIRHRNLVKITSLCSSVDFEGNDFKALILEFMPKGNLEQWLHPDVSMLSEFRSLSLVQRLNIAIDIASALEYLHNGGHTPIVHCDLKPSNVLLDDDMCAHLSDFGLAKFLSQDSNFNDSLTGSIGLRGSIGYIAPEYGMGSRVSTLGDVYSYGILLLEIFTGRSPTDEIFKDDKRLHQYAEESFPGKVLDIIDPRLFHNKAQGSKGSTKTEDLIMVEEMHCLVSVIRIALACSMEDPGERMDIARVTKQINAVKSLLVSQITY